MMRQKPNKPNLSWRAPALAGLLTAIALVGGGVAWASMSEIAGAVIASGSLVVKGKPKSVQHLDGGVVEAIRVETGDVVEEGAVLIELDRTTIAANLSIYRGRLREAIVRRARLRAEAAGEETVDPARIDAEGFSQDDLAETIAQQDSLMKARAATRTAQLAQFDEKIGQFDNQIAGVRTLIEHKRQQVDNFEEERASLSTLVEKGLSARNNLLALDRSISDTLGQLGEHEAEIARINNSVAETRMSKLQVQREFQESVMTELEDVQTKIEELDLQIEATAKQLARTTIRSPVAGTVHELNVFTVGGIIQPGQTVMQIIPRYQPVDIELTVDTRSIDQVYAGQAVVVRFPAFNQRTTPQIVGTIETVSPSSVVDQRTGREFYRVMVGVEDEELAALNGRTLMPGMPVEGYIQTGRRVVLSYLTKPLADNFQKVFREE